MRKASTHLTEEPKISGVMFALAVLFIIAILPTFNISVELQYGHKKLTLNLDIPLFHCFITIKKEII